MTAPLIHKHLESDSGFSVLELLIVVAMISVTAGFVVMQVARARQVMARENAAQQLVVFLEKARVDSVRRRPETVAQMAQVTILNSNFYSVTTDSTGDGTLDPPQVITFPVDSNLRFQPPYPRTIYFNWRGRIVDAGGNLANSSYLKISSTTGYGTTQIDLTSSGQSSLDGPPPLSAVQNSNAPSPTFREDMQVP